MACSIRLAVATTFAFICVVSATAQASAYKTLYEFTPPNTGASGLIRAANGILYGTTSNGGFTNQGTVFSFDPKTGAYTTLHEFGSGIDGAEISGNPLSFDNSGGIIGTTVMGGANNEGTIYRIDLGSGTYSVLFSFPPDSVVTYPDTKLVLDKMGNIYGVLRPGGNAGLGAVFKVDPKTSTMTYLYKFPGGKGSQSPGNITPPDSNNLVYGTTNDSGDYKARSGILFS